MTTAQPESNGTMAKPRTEICVRSASCLTFRITNEPFRTEKNNMQFKTKSGLVDIPNDEVMAASRDIASSAGSTSETAAPSGSLGVGGGCLEVSSAEALCVEWKSWAAVWHKRCDAAQARKDYDDVRLSNARAEIYEECEKELRRLVERAKSRQPQDNA